MHTRTKVLAALAVTLTLSLAAGGTQAQTFPSKPMTISVGLAAGGVVDWMARSIGTELQKRWGQPVIVENRPGAGGMVAKNQVQQAVPDGHTLMAYSQSLVHLPLFVRDATITFGKDITPLTPAFFAPYVIITNAQVPAKNLREFVAYAKAYPGKLNIGHTVGGSHQLDSFRFLKATGLDIAAIPYKGGAPALLAIVSNEAQLYLGAVFGLDAQVRAGKITALAVTSEQRFPSVPDIPTVKEAMGLEFDASVQYGFFTTGGTPKPIVDRLAREIADIVKGDMSAQIRKQGYEPLTMTSDEWTAVILAEGRRGREVAQAAGIKPQ